MTFEKVRKLFADQLGKAEDEITMESDIVNDLQADSLDIYILISSFDDEFGISIPEEEAVNLKTIGDIVKYIDSHK
ncbi:MAG: acyl carrier protein [Clostridia bacterium]|nr:acyl carrier protein [Clostridia bacterium]